MVVWSVIGERAVGGARRRKSVRSEEESRCEVGRSVERRFAEDGRGVRCSRRYGQRCGKEWKIDDARGG